MKKAVSFLLFLLLWVGGQTLAQQCPDYVAETLADVAANCSELARNEICYGNVQVTVSSTADMVFEQPGDIINLADIQSLSISSTETENWGMAVMSLQANLPATLPGQNVTVLLFGNTEFAPVDESLQAFYFTGGIGQPNCNQAPDGIILQSPLGYAVTMTINGARLQFGSTVMLQQTADSMSVSTLAGMAILEANGVQQFVLQGTSSSIALDSSNLVTGTPSMAVPVDATGLTPFVQAVNSSGLMLPSYEDAAANPYIQYLQTTANVPSLSAETPVVAIPEEQIAPTVVVAEEMVFYLSREPEVPVVVGEEIVIDLSEPEVPVVVGEEIVIDLSEPEVPVVVGEEMVFQLPPVAPVYVAEEMVFYLSPQREEIQPLSGRWVLVEQHHEVTGSCLDDATNGDNGGGVIEQEDEGRPICPLADSAGIVFQSSVYERLGTNLYGREYSGDRPNYSGEGTIHETMSWHYEVVSPTRIVMTFTNSEEGGCTVTQTFIYELAEEDSAACDDVIISTDEDANTSEDASLETYPVVVGTYHSDDLYVSGCEADFSSQFEDVSISVQADSVDFTAGASVFNLPAMGSVYLYYEGSTTLSLIATAENQISFSYGDGTCMMAGIYNLDN